MPDMMMLLFHVWIASAIILFILWLESCRTSDASYVDVGWAFSIACGTIYLGLMLEGDLFRRFALVAMILAWAGRLISHLVVRIRREGKEDKRYAALRKFWGKEANRNYFFVFQAQAILAVILVGSLYPGMNSTWPQNFWVYLGMMIWLIGFLGESIADEQLRKFKADPAHQGKTCQAGLWAYSRHPNYFFEWVMWLGYAVFNVSFLHGWLGFIAASIMLVFLIYVTGIPYSEQQALLSRGEDYRRYQQQTSMFFPWFKRKI